MRIINLEDKPKNKTKIFLDNGENFILSSKVLENMGLKLNSDISQELYDKTISDLLYKDACTKSLKYLSSSARSTWELRENIKEYPEKIIDKTIKFLSQYNYANDERFAENFIYDCLTVKFYGKIKISFELHNKKIAKQIIDDSIEKYINNDLEYESAKKFVESHVINPKEITLKNKLYRRGYSFGVIDLIVKEFGTKK